MVRPPRIDLDKHEEWYDRLLGTESKEIGREILEELRSRHPNSVRTEVNGREAVLDIFRIDFTEDSVIYEWAEDLGNEMWDRTREDTESLSKERYAEYAVIPAFKFFKGLADAYFHETRETQDKIAVIELPDNNLEYVSGVDDLLRDIHSNALSKIPNYSKYMNLGSSIVSEGYRRDHPEATMMDRDDLD